VSDFQEIADRFEIEALRGEATDAVMMHDYHRAASLFTEDGSVRMPHANVEVVSREGIPPGPNGFRACGTTSYRPRTRDGSALRAIPRLVVSGSPSSGACPTAART